MASRTYKKLDNETFEETESTSETTTRTLDRAELQTKIDHWKQNQVELQLETDKGMVDLKRDIDRAESILATR